jgi:hypothetical protein
MGLGRMTSIIHSHGHAQNQTTSCLMYVGARLVLGRATCNLDSQNSPRLGLGGSHHLPPCSIFRASPRGPIQMAFCPMTPKWESRNCQNWDSYDFAGP